MGTDEEPNKQKYKRVPVETNRQNYTEILKVLKLDTHVKTEIKESGNYEDRSLVLTLGIKCMGSPLDKMVAVEQVRSQSSLDSSLNPTDYYFQVKTDTRPGIAVGFGPPKFIKIEIKYIIDQRRASEKDQPWDLPAWRSKENIRHLSFYAGMHSGLHRWRLYKLDITDLEDIKFKFLKEYSFVQGQIVDHS